MLTTLIVYCAAIVAISVLGGLVPLLMRLTHNRMQLLLSLVAGVLVGVALLHMLPHALHDVDDPEGIFIAVLIGFLTMFLLERFFCFHHHEHAVEEQGGEPCTHSHHELGWAGALFGLCVHTLIAGIALGSACAASTPGVGLLGFGTFLAILLHKPFDALTITALMRSGGVKAGWSHLVNVLFALMVPAGIVLFFVIDGVTDVHEFSAWALAFSAGTFLCVGCADLLPELQFHKHDRIKLSLALILGLVIAWAAGLLEPDHDSHGHDQHDHGHDQHDHEHDQHDHEHDQHDHEHEHDHAQETS